MMLHPDSTPYRHPTATFTRIHEQVTMVELRAQTAGESHAVLLPSVRGRLRINTGISALLGPLEQSPISLRLC